MLRNLPGTRGITRANAREMSKLGNEARLERKREVMREAALLAVEDARFKKYGNEAHLAEIAYTMQQAATTASNPRLVDAARFQLEQTGYQETKQAPAGNTVDDLRGLVQALAQLAHEAVPQVIDATVRDAE